MGDTSTPYPERRHEDQLTKWRLEQMEEREKDNSNKIDQVQKDLTELKDEINDQFADLRKTLFERPIFVTVELLKIELDSRDRAWHAVRKEISDIKENSVSSKRYTITVGVAIVGVFFAPFFSAWLQTHT